MVETTSKMVGTSSFIQSAWEAYNKHYHLSIRPDDVWMSIITQFSLYLNKNHELLGDKFVDFNDKKELVVYCPDEFSILNAPFDKVSIEFTNQISSNIKDPLIKDWLITEFTTTTSTDKICFSIALMSIMKNYFSYTSKTCCGLPEVTLNGTVEDWINLKERTLKLLQFNLSKTNEIKKWVIDYLLPVIDKFIESSQGNPDIKWWNQIVDYNQRSGGGTLTGWLSVFCVFNNDGNFVNDHDHSLSSSFPWPRTNGIQIPNGFLLTPMKLVDFDNTVYSSFLYAGHFASKIDKDIILPSIDWFIIKQ